MPVWTPESSQPGVTPAPPASMTGAPEGAVRFAPTAAIRPPRITTVPRSIVGPETGRIRAFVMATTSPPVGITRGAGAGTRTAGAARLAVGTDDEETEDAGAENAGIEDPRTEDPGTEGPGTDGPGTPRIPSWKSLRGTLPVSARSKTCAPDEDALGVRVRAERIARPDHDVRVLPGLERPRDLVDAERLRGIDRQPLHRVGPGDRDAGVGAGADRLGGFLVQPLNAVGAVGLDV